MFNLIVNCKGQLKIKTVCRQKQFSWMNITKYFAKCFRLNSLQNIKAMLMHKMQNKIQYLASSAGISPEESGGGKKFGEMPAINRHKYLHCAYRLVQANFDKLKLRGSRKGLRQGVNNFLSWTPYIISVSICICYIMSNKYYSHYQYNYTLSKVFHFSWSKYII
jgi:hypothetical protein